jgi:DNA-binding MarR family transcriptional regulator
MCIPWNLVPWNQLPRDALASTSVMANLPALFADLVRLEIELWDAVEARLRAELGVGLGTAQTLAVVAAVEDCRVHDVVRGLSITVGGASKTVDRLERNGLVVRRAHPSDRRSSVIALTRTGATTHAKAQRLIAAELDARVGGVLPDRTLDQLHRAITKLRAALTAG